MLVPQDIDLEYITQFGENRNIVFMNDARTEMIVQIARQQVQISTNCKKGKKKGKENRSVKGSLSKCGPMKIIRMTY